MKKLKIKMGAGKPKLPENSYSFIIGNGTSRKDLDIKQLMDYGILFGCNWFFQEEFRPHVLVASDEPMTKTILTKFKQYPRNNHFYTWYPKPGSGAKKAPCPEKFAAGPMGAHIAVENFKSKAVFMIGMDFFGFGSMNKDQNGVMNNMYEGMKHYAKKSPEGQLNGAPTYRNWQRRWQWILKNYPDVEFYHVDPFEGKSPERLRGFDNFHQISFANLIDHLVNDAELVDIMEKTDEDRELAHEPNPDNVRAVLERQLAGQENVLYMDYLTPQQVFDIKVKGLQSFAKTNGKQGQPSVNINGWNILIPIMHIREGGHVRLPRPEEMKHMFERELKERYDLVVESGRTPEQLPMIEGPDAAQQSPSLAPPPPPPPALKAPPPPPPPPPPA